MKNLTSFLGRILPFAIVCSLSITTALAQQAQVRIVRADINGNQINMYLDHDSLQRFVNQAVGAMDADADGSLLEWSDVLTNKNNPEMNVNFSGYSVFGIDSLTSTGVLLADSLVLNKDAEITGKLILGDSLAVAGAAALDSTLSVAGYTRVNDSLYVLKAALFAADVSVGDSLLVTGAAALDSTLAVTGITTLSDSLVVAGNSDLTGTLDVTGETTITGELHASDSLVVAGNSDLTGTLDVTGETT
ncbi:hypothetical protein N8891_06095, partial [Flavobacteriales bacterium]|nr:hypothetical protein [Flavobacteriales bacterium]